MEIAENQQTKERRIFRSASFLLFMIVPLLSLVAIQPILTGILPWRGDGLLHLVRLAELERAVRAGVLFPRWSPGLGYGFGFPLFHYYAPFSYYVGLLPRLLGFSLPVSLALSYVGALWVLGWGVALWARDVWRDWLGVLTAVLATLYAPYILYNSYHRAALAELWGLAWLVLVLWAVNRMIDEQRLKIKEYPSAHIFNPSTNSGQVLLSLIFISVFYALLILSHNITAMIGTPLIVGYAIFLLVGKRPFNLYSLIFILLSLFLGLALSAFFWLPAFFERNLVQIENLTTTSGFTYLNHFLTWIEVLAWPQTAVPLQVNPPIPRSLSWPVVLLAILAWLPIKRLKIEGLKVQRLGLTIAALVCLLMVLPWSQPLWEALGLLAFVQFPWRFLGPASIFMAMLAGLGAMNFYGWLRSQALVNRPKSHYSLFIIVVSSLILLFALPWLFPSRAQSLPQDMSPADTIQFEVETGWLGTTAAADYLPRTVQALPMPDNGRSGLAATQLPHELAMTGLQLDFSSIRFNYESDEPMPITFHQFMFPGWQAAVDGVAVELLPSEPEGLITAVLPPGEHIFELTFGNTPLRRVAHVISVISFITLLALIIYAVAHKSESRATSQFTVQNSHFIIYALATVLLIFTLKTFFLDHSNSPLRTTHMDAPSSATSSAINFGNIIQLLGAEIPHEPIPADQTIDITLYWQALPPVYEEYSVSVQLLGENGRRVAQSDSFHPAGLPLPRWQAGEYGVDAHNLTPLPAAPPGDYQLVVFVYHLATGQRLDLLNEAGLPSGNEYGLGRVTLVAPSQFPEPSDLTIGQTKTEGGGESPFLAENVQLLGYDAPLAEVTVGDVIPLTLYWHTPQTPAQDYESDIWIGCDNGITAVSLPPDRMTTPHTDWQRGQIQRAEFNIPLLPVDEAGNPLHAGICTLYLRLAAGEEANSIALESFTISVPERNYTLPETAVPLNQSFANVVTLAGFTLDQTSFAPGATIPLTLFWQPRDVIDANYKVFVQLLAENGRLLTQQDQIPANSARPTTGWIPGEFVQDEYALVLPPDTAPGNYQLITGLYSAETGERLPLADSSGDAITIPVSIEVKTAE